MSTTTDLEDRLLRWQELRQQGREPSAAELCLDRPELARSLEQKIQKLRIMEGLLPLDTPPAPVEPAQFTLGGHEILEKLGEGGMGVVYRARDRSGRLVALKCMKQFDGQALPRFKKECQVLHDLSHPNLITLYEVGSEGGQWFFTMELIDGRPLLDRLGPSADELPPTLLPGDNGAVQVDPPVHSPVNPERVRAAFRQLADGLLALHERGVLHRDVKPSNVLMTASGRVVLLDFGLVTEALLDERSVTEQGFAGTLLYMAPEQAAGRAGPASDWYSFGVMLHQALTGQHPFRDPAHQMPWMRLDHNPPPPHTLTPGVPEDLSCLCAALLQSSPDRRPSGTEIRRQFGPVASVGPAPLASLFLGRERDMAFLTRAFAGVQSGKSLTVLLHGESGVGKSALVRHFLDEIRQQDEQIVVLTGRCYERVSVPYKALDGLVDSLARFWKRHPRAGELLPRDVGPLVRVFPVLEQVPVISRAPRVGTESPDPHELRRRAFAALREVLGRAGDRWPQVVHLDDLQWGDVDSARMLTELLSPPDPPRLLLLAGFRAAERETSPFLLSFLRMEKTGQEMERRELALGVLSQDEARALAARLLRTTGDDGVATAAARESGGNPFFVYQLVQAIQSGERELTLDRVIGARVDALSDDQRRLLEIIAVAGRPLPQPVALAAARVNGEGRKGLIELQAARFLRGSNADEQEVETYHDRVREAVVARLSTATLTDHHRQLALVLESLDGVDPEMLAIHFHGGEQPARAAVYYARAAERTARALAFDRAARLYRLALELRPSRTAETPRLRLGLAEALANAGRGAEAGQTYLDTVPEVDPTQVLDLQRRAAEQYLRVGRLHEGLDLLRAVLRHVGIPYPETASQVKLSLLWGRLQVWWVGTRFRPRTADQVPPEDLLKIDVCWSAASILCLFDTQRGLAFLSRYYYPLALRAGEPGRVALALLDAAVYHALWTGAASARSEPLLRVARALAEQHGSPYHRALVDLMSGCAALLRSEWKKVCEMTEKAVARLRDECTGCAWEIGVGHHYRYTALHAMGNWKQYAHELPPLLRESHERGDLFTATSLQLHASLIDLMFDDPNQARRTVIDALRRWPSSTFYLQHYHAMRMEIEATLYAGQFEEAWELLQVRWPELRQSRLLLGQVIRLTMLYLHGRCALAASAQQSDSGRATQLARIAEGDARRIEREGVPWAIAAGRMLRATLFARQGKRDEAMTLLAAAQEGFETSDMRMCAAVAGYRFGQLVGGERGRELVDRASDFIRGQDVRNPGGVLAIYTPGFGPG